MAGVASLDRPCSQAFLPNDQASRLLNADSNHFQTELFLQYLSTVHDKTVTDLVVA